MKTEEIILIVALFGAVIYICLLISRKADLKHDNKLYEADLARAKKNYDDSQRALSREESKNRVLEIKFGLLAAIHNYEAVDDVISWVVKLSLEELTDFKIWLAKYFAERLLGGENPFNFYIRKIRSKNNEYPEVCAFLVGTIEEALSDKLSPEALAKVFAKLLLDRAKGPTRSQDPIDLEAERLLVGAVKKYSDSGLQYFADEFQKIIKLMTEEQKLDDNQQKILTGESVKILMKF